jgi:hypothetical protein
MVLTSLFAVSPDVLVAVFNELEMRAVVATVRLMKASFKDSVSDKVHVPDAPLAFVWVVSQGGQGPTLLS